LGGRGAALRLAADRERQRPVDPTARTPRNYRGVVAKVKPSAKLETGRVLERIGDPGFDVPTKIAARGRYLFAVNARFTTPPTPTTPYWITRIDK
jgi:hypothetical protein